MAGGFGERFWPVSTPHRPKQLLPIGPGGQTLLGATLERLGGLVEPARTLIATSELQFEAIRALQLPVRDENLVAEPCKRNTAGCLVWATALLLSRGASADDAVAVLPADHRIHPVVGFVRSLDGALAHAEKSADLVTIGIEPTRPETGYGYIELGDPTKEGQPAVFKVVRFHEKPALETAERFAASGRHLWNSGMFFWRIGVFLEQLGTAQPQIAEATSRIARALQAGRLEEAERIFEQLPSISIDYALMERAASVAVVRAEFEWDDVGAWDALSRSLESDSAGNVSKGEALFIDSGDNVAYTEGPRICMLGVDDLVVVATPEAILVCPKSRSQEVRRVVDELRKSVAKEGTTSCD